MPDTHHFKYSGGSQNWPPATYCAASPSCDRPDDHLHCTGNVGMPARFRIEERSGVSLFKHPEPREGFGWVTSHWHYEGCMIRVTTLDGEDIELVPSLHPDHVEVLEEVPAELEFEKWAVEGVL